MTGLFFWSEFAISTPQPFGKERRQCQGVTCTTGGAVAQWTMAMAMIAGSYPGGTLASNAHHCNDVVIIVTITSRLQ